MATATRTPPQELSRAAPARPPRREVWIGLFAILGLIGAIVTLLSLTDPGMFRGRLAVTTSVEDAGGLRRGDPVQMRGVNIGRVQGFDIAADRVDVHLELERGYPVPADSRVLLRSSGLLGGMVAEIMPGRSEQDLRGGETLPGGTVRGMLDPAAGLGDQAETVLGRVEDLLARETVADARASVAELRDLLAELSALVAAERQEIRVLTGSLRRTAQGVERATAGPELQRAIARHDSVAARLNVASASLGEAGASLEVFARRLEQGEGTLGRLSADDELYRNMNEAAANVNLAARSLTALLDDIRANPRRYLNLELF